MSELDDRELRAWRAFYLLQVRLRHRIETHLQTEHGLSHADYTVLISLSGAPDGSMRLLDLGAGLDWEKSRLHHQVTRMHRRGLVRREPDPAGSRAVRAVLTDEGRQALAAAAPAHMAQVRELFVDRLSSSQQDQITEICEELLEALDTGQEPAATS